MRKRPHPDHIFCLLSNGMQKHIMHTMKKNMNPVIRVYPQTRKKLKVIAAQMDETMQDTVERLATQELERLKKGDADATQQKDQASPD